MRELERQRSHPLQALVARRHGVNVNGIVLWVFGGVAQLEGDSPDPRAEFQLTAAGPATSFALAGAGLGAAWLLSRLGASSLLVAAVGWLGGINGLLGFFNLIPAFPLDGGRILRAWLWRHWRDRARATTVAAKVGKAGGFVLMGAGALEFLFGGGALGGLWLVVLGWFITVAADQQHQQVSRQSHAGELRVSDAMSAQPVAAPVQATVAEVIECYVLPSRFSSFPITDSTGLPVGLTTVQRMAKLPRESWATTPITTTTVPLAHVVQCGPDDPLADVAARLESSPDRRAIVLEGGRLVGILTPSDIKRALGRAELFGQPSGAPDPAQQAPGRNAPGQSGGGIPWGTGTASVMRANSYVARTPSDPRPSQ